MPIWIVSSFQHVVSILRSVDLNLNFFTCACNLLKLHQQQTRNAIILRDECWAWAYMFPTHAPIHHSAWWSMLKIVYTSIIQIIILFSPESWNESSAQRMCNQMHLIILSILINGRSNCRLNVLVIVFDRRPKRTKSNRSWTWRQIKWIYEKKTSNSEMNIATFALNLLSFLFLLRASNAWERVIRNRDIRHAISTNRSFWSRLTHRISVPCLFSCTLCINDLVRYLFFFCHLHSFIMF